ncbi:GNAT family N-acetyltransferase [Fredinandcohnia sp. FSL W7-1320]|uniref:GNAT family N-acetyltransferase n=1 Tax=Fredinandcohnia sp. FSL W7-1320 TaxID=2954540 RepID=UPI0030FDE031
MRVKFKCDVTEDIRELQETIHLQKMVWGDDTVTSLPQMVAAIHNGGVVVVAKSIDNQKIVGFCYGFAGYDNITKQTHLCSHMMAIDPEHRNHGIGKELKLVQRQWAIKNGYKKMTWTFDPLEIRNGYLNLCKLGGYVNIYIPDYYGNLEDKLNRGLPSDRFLIEWELASERAEIAASGDSIFDDGWEDYPSLLHWRLENNQLIPEDVQPLSNHKGFLVAIPKEIQRIKNEKFDIVKKWRVKTRDLFTIAFFNGYKVVGVLRSEEPVHYYVLEK